MKYKSTIFNTILVIVTIITGIIIANQLYYSGKNSKKVNDITYIHVENNITPFVFNRIAIPKVTDDATLKEKSTNSDQKSKESNEDKKNIQQEPVKTPEIVSSIAFDGLTMEQLVIKLNNNMKNEISNMGQLYAEYSLSLGVDPYVALAITLQETGCSWKCYDKLVNCNNVGGQRGSPSCNGGSYKKYNTLEEGIKGFIDNLSDNYYKKGLNTPELMNSKYAESTEWAAKINNYVNTIKSS